MSTARDNLKGRVDYRALGVVNEWYRGPGGGLLNHAGEGKEYKEESTDALCQQLLAELVTARGV